MQAKKLQTWQSFLGPLSTGSAFSKIAKGKFFSRVKSWLEATILPQTSSAAPIFPVSVGRHCVYICSI